MPKLIPPGSPFIGALFWPNCPVASVGDTDVCWRWQGEFWPDKPDGYGLYYGFAAHRVAFWLYHDCQPGRKDVCHTCDHPWCINPDHLFLGTAKDNAQDRERKNRHAHPGRSGPRNKIDEDAVRDIRNSREPAKTLMRRYGIDSESWIYKIKSREAWKHVV